MPHAKYTLSKAEKTKFFDWLKCVKFPDGYASNISRCVNTQKGKISGMKRHNCHVLLQCLLPIAIRGYFSFEIRTPLIKLCFLFKELCSWTLKFDVLNRMKHDIVVILCKLEMNFPPASFDVMVHLAVRLPRMSLQDLFNSVGYIKLKGLWVNWSDLWGIEHIRKGQLLRDIYPLNVWHFALCIFEGFIKDGVLRRGIMMGGRRKWV